MGADTGNAEQAGDSQITHRRAMLLAARWVFLLALLQFASPFPFLLLIYAPGILIAAWFTHRSWRVMLYVPLFAVLAAILLFAAMMLVFIYAPGHLG